MLSEMPRFPSCGFSTFSEEKLVWKVLDLKFKVKSTRLNQTENRHLDRGNRRERTAKNNSVGGLTR